MRLLVIALLCSTAIVADVTNVNLQGTSPTQAVISFTVPDPNDCLVQVSTDPAFGSFVNDTNNTLFTDSQKCNRNGSIVNGNDVVFVIGLRTSQKGTDGMFHSRALKSNTVHFYRIISQFQQDSGSPRTFQTENPPLGAMYPEPPPFDPTLTAFGNYAWPEFDWSDPSKSVIEPLTGLEMKPFTRPGTISQHGTSPQAVGTTPFDVHGVWTNPASAGNNGASFATTSGGPTDYLFIPAAWFHNSNTGGNVPGWDASYGLDDLQFQPYGSATMVDGIHNVVSVCLSIDSGQTCASSSFNITLSGTSGAVGGILPQAQPAPIFAGWNMPGIRQGQKAPVKGTGTVAGNVFTINPQLGQNLDVTTPVGSKVFISGAASMSPTPCPNDMCTVAVMLSSTKIQLVESCATSGCPNSTAFTMAAFGFRIAKTAATGSVSFSLGWLAAYSDMSDNGVNGLTSLCSPNPVTVTTTRSGAPLSTNALGYFCSQSKELYLFIPSLSEVRLLSILSAGGANQIITNGLTAGSGSLGAGSNFAISGFDQNDGSVAYSVIGQNGLFYFMRAQYDTTATDGNGHACDYREWPSPIGTSTGLFSNQQLKDCMKWTNITPAGASPAMDISAQIQRGYQTGLNSLGATVTNTPHAGWDLSYMTLYQFPTIGGGLATFTLFTGQNFISSGLSVIGTFNMSTGVLTHVSDTWSQLPMRFGSCHGCVGDGLGTWRQGTMNILVDDAGGHDYLLNGAWQTNITQVNRAGSGSTPVWDTNTALAYNEGYTCPAFTQSLVDLGGSGVNCIQVKVSSEACSHVPSVNGRFADGHTEVQDFPCTTNVAGTPTVPSTTGANTWSKLQDMIVGDWVQDLSFTFLGSTERLVIASKTINAANDIDLWLIRWTGCRGAKFPPGLQFAQGSLATCEYPNPTLSAHSNGWSLRMTVPFSYGVDSGAATSILDPTSLTTPWIAGNFHKVSTHGAIGASPTPGNYTSFTPDGINYDVTYDLPFTSTIYSPTPTGSVIENPGFAGASGASGPVLQNYGSNTQFKAPASERIWGLDYRHINPSNGAGLESPNSVIRNGSVAWSVTLQRGTSQTYQLATNGSGLDSVSQGNPDPKRLPMVGIAGRFLLKDYSSSAIGNVFGDAQNYGWCRAMKMNECRTGSAVGNIYVSVPSVSTDAGSCYSDQYENNVPCVFTLASTTAQIMQIDLSRTDTNGSHQRRLGYGLAGPLRQYQFNNSKPSQDGGYMIFPGNWVDGQRRELMLAQLPPFPRGDAYDRTTFVPVPVSVDADPNAPNARVRFGYAENGPVDSFFCTTRQDSCSTDVPALTPTDPYSFISEAPTPRDCSNGCTINIPAISERVVYYVIDWLSTAGTVVRSSPWHAQVVAGTVLPSRRGPTLAPNILFHNAVVR